MNKALKYKFAEYASRYLAHFYKSQKPSILLYHAIGKQNLPINYSSIYSLDINIFLEHINFLVKNKIPVVNLNQIDLNKKSVSITFDDGLLNVYDNALPILLKNNIPCTIFIITSYLNNNNYINVEILKKISKYKNVTIGSHSKSHIDLTKCSKERLITEIVDSKNILENIIEKKVESFSYPYGKYKSEFNEILENVGYKYALSSNFGTIDNLNNNFSLPRIDMWSHDDVKILNDKIQGKWNWMKYYNNFFKKN